MDPQDAPVLTPAGSFCCGNTIRFIQQLSEEEKKRYRGVCVENGFLSVAVIPIRYGERVLGAAHLADETENRVSFKALEFIESMAPLIGEAINRFNLEEELRESESRLRLLSSELLTVQEAERKRIAREIHDSIGQTLAAIKFGLESKLSQMSAGAPPPGVSVENIISLTQNGIEESRRIQMDLRPPLLDDLGILATIGWFTREFQKVYVHISVEKQISVEENEIADSLRTVLFRVMQEAMNNVAKHSKADLARLILRKTADKIELSIEDNGEGFDPESIKQGLGLTSMRERTELSGGTFEVESILGKGTTIKAQWPI
jgi:signal transduction histidine kinase